MELIGGSLVEILEGPHKSMLAEVKQVYEKGVQVELKSSGAIIVVDRNHLAQWTEPTGYEILNSNPAHQIYHGQNVGGAHGMAVYDNREISMPSNPAQTWPQMDAAKNVGSAPLPTNILHVPSFMNPIPVGKTVKINFGPYQDQIAVVTKMLRNSRRSHQRYKAKLCLQSNGQTVVIGRNHFEAVPTPINPGAPLPGNPAYPVPQSSGAQDIPSLNPTDNVPGDSGRTGMVARWI